MLRLLNLAKGPVKTYFEAEIIDLPHDIKDVLYLEPDLQEMKDALTVGGESGLSELAGRLNRLYDVVKEYKGYVDGIIIPSDIPPYVADRTVYWFYKKMNWRVFYAIGGEMGVVASMMNTMVQIEIGGKRWKPLTTPSFSKDGESMTNTKDIDRNTLKRYLKSKDPAERFAAVRWIEKNDLVVDYIKDLKPLLTDEDEIVRCCVRSMIDERLRR